VAAGDRRRGVLERLLGLANPVVVADFTPPVRALADGLWLFQRKIRLPGGVLIPAHTTIVRLPSRGLLVHSPFQLDPRMRRELDGLGRVAQLVAPSTFHYLYLAESRAAFPAAEVHLVPGLRERRPAVGSGTVLGAETPAAFAGRIEHAVLGPTRGAAEAVFLDRATRTLILTDLAFNMQSATNWIDRAYWKATGVWQRFGPTLLVARVLLREPALVRPFLARVLAWDFDRIVVGHGDVVERDGREIFRAAFARWL
jgi:Domain of unknown function (DUF4336)